VEYNNMHRLPHLRFSIRSGCGLLAALLLVISHVALGAVEPSDTVAINAVGRGTLLVRAADDQPLHAAPLVDTAVEMHITGLIARVSVRQTFSNTSSEWQNGVYVFPLPERAAVDTLKLEVGARILEGQIKERAQARQIYETARAAGVKASLVEQQRPNLFTNSVANIGPGERVTVHIEYQQSITYDAPWFALRFPMTVGVRYIPGNQAVGGVDGGGWAVNTTQVPDASHITPPMTLAGAGHDNPVSLDITLTAGIALASIESPYHALKQQEVQPRVYHLELAQGVAPADRDFELRWKAAPGTMPSAALFSESHDDARYGLLMVMPPAASAAKAIAAAREIVYVIDTSGSMSGTSLEQARAALLFALEHLQADDRFNIIQFNSVVEKFSDTALPASADNLARARDYVQGLESTGGTEMAAALNAVLDGSEQNGRLRQVVFMTDGSVGNESELLNIIDQRLGASRLSTVGIGAAPNSYFMREAAANGRGTFTYIGAVQEVEEKMRALFEKLEFPVLTDIHIEGGDAQLEMWPKRIRDLYVNEPLMVSVRQDKALDSMRLRGTLVGKPWQVTVPLTLGANARGLDIEWARQKIAALEQSATRGAESDAIQGQITELGLRHHIVTAHTSLVAVDVTPTRPADQASHDANVPNKMPAGWTMTPPQASLPQTATPMALQWLAALGLGVLSFIARRMGRARSARA
jgi:Ca-activated chloride channel family protein